MLKLSVGAAAAALLIASSPAALAETCDAGHGCKITCDNGCGAIYWIETGKCSKFCAEPEKPAAAISQMSAPAPITGNFHNASRAEIIKMLTGEDK